MYEEANKMEMILSGAIRKHIKNTKNQTDGPIRKYNEQNLIVQGRPNLYKGYQPLYQA